MKTTTKMAMAALVGGLAFGALAAGPAVSDVTVRQRWPWSRLVDIHYVLAADPSSRTDVSLSAYNGSDALSVPAESLSGDLYGTSQGMKHIVWDPTKSAYTNVALTQFRVNLTPTNSPVYLVVDLTASAGSPNQLEYVYPGDARLVTEGRWTNVWFGATNDTLYKTKTDKLVLRRVHAGTFKMGYEPGVTTNVTKDYYIGIFEVTQEQWKKVKGSYPGGFTVDRAARPASASYNAIRGATNDTPVIDWPATGSAVTTNTFISVLREKTGLTGFDLPNAPQWEFACRAGTTTYYSDGLGTPANTASNAQIDVLGRYKWDGGYYWTGTEWKEATTAFGPTNGTATVGTYLPNNWGIHDTHGNVAEWCLEWSSAGKRLARGGAYVDAGNCVRSAFVGADIPTANWNCYGFRVILALP